MHQLQVEEEYGLTRELLPPCAVLAPVLGKAVQVHVHPVLGQVQLPVEHRLALLTQEDRQGKAVDGHMLLLEWGEVQTCADLTARKPGWRTTEEAHTKNSQTLSYPFENTKIS